jgi:hypothetical protein
MVSGVAALQFMFNSDSWIRSLLPSGSCSFAACQVPTGDSPTMSSKGPVFQSLWRFGSALLGIWSGAPGSQRHGQCCGTQPGQRLLTHYQPILFHILPEMLINFSKCCSMLAPPLRRKRFTLHYVPHAYHPTSDGGSRRPNHQPWVKRDIQGQAAWTGHPGYLIGVFFEKTPARWVREAPIAIKHGRTNIFIHRPSSLSNTTN